MHHNLKTFNEDYFDSIVSGKKVLRIRDQDRNFQSGDTITIEEFKLNPANRYEMFAEYTGRKFHATIEFISYADNAGKQEDIISLFYLNLLIVRLKYDN